MLNDGICLLGMKAIGDDRLYSMVEIFPCNLYEVCLSLDLSRLTISDCINITFGGINGFDRNGLIEANVVLDGNDTEAIVSSILLNSDTQVVFEIFDGSIVIDIDGESIDGVLEKQSSLTLTGNQFGGKEKVTIHLILRSVPLKIEVNSEYNMYDDVDEEELDFPLHEGATITLRLKNIGDRIERGVNVTTLLSEPALKYIPGTTNIVRVENTHGFKNDLSNAIVKSDGLCIGDLRPGDDVIVDFDVKLSDEIISVNGGTSLSVCTNVRTETAGFWQFETYLDKESLERTYRKQ